MATTDARAGFRLPWSSDRPSTDATDGEPAGENAHDTTNAWPSEGSADSADHALEASADVATEASAEASAEAATAVAERAEAVSATADPAPWQAASQAPTGRKPSKFLADLTKAMQTAAEEARGLAIGQLQAEAKAHVESIHGRSSTEAASLRRAADDDVAAVREWSKAEIARVREDTERKITDRKAKLETEIERHAGVIEREIDAVQGTVAAFEADMATFFERLLAEEDPTRFATMAENLPEPPSFEGILAAVAAAPVAEPETVVETVDEPVAVVDEDTTDSTATDALETETVDDAVEGIAEPAAEVTAAEADEVDTGNAETDEADTGNAETGEAEMGFTRSADGFEGGEGADGEVDREAAFAAIQAAAEAAASAEVAADAAARAEAVADVAIEIIGNSEGEADPRFAALGLSPDYDAAEAEAYAAAGSSDGEEIPTIDDDALAARLAGLVPGHAKKGTGEATSTQVIVVGLVSVASIASFKRHLGRLSGVQSVGVSSGPDGEFIFAVAHGPDVVLRDVLPSLPSFQARVTSSSDGIIHVTAHDPESDA